MDELVELDVVPSGSVPTATPQEPSAVSGTKGLFSSHELLENGVATFVDVSSIMVAYAIGMHESSFALGIAYGFIDAFLVVWMRRPFARMMRWVVRRVRPQAISARSL